MINPRKAIAVLFSALLLTGTVSCASKVEHPTTASSQNETPTSSVTSESEQPSQTPSPTTTSSTTSTSKTPLPEWNDLKFKDWCSLLTPADRAPYFKTEEKIKISSDLPGDEEGPGCVWHTDPSIIVINAGDLAKNKAISEEKQNGRKISTSKGVLYVNFVDSDMICMMSIAYPGSQKVSIDFSIMRPAELVSNKKEKLCDVAVPLVEKIVEKIARTS